MIGVRGVAPETLPQPVGLRRFFFLLLPDPDAASSLATALELESAAASEEAMELAIAAHKALMLETAGK